MKPTEGKKRLTLKMTPEKIRSLKVMAAARGMTISNYILFITSETAEEAQNYETI